MVSLGIDALLALLLAVGVSFDTPATVIPAGLLVMATLLLVFFYFTPGLYITLISYFFDTETAGWTDRKAIAEFEAEEYPPAPATRDHTRLVREFVAQHGLALRRKRHRHGSDWTSREVSILVTAQEGVVNSIMCKDHTGRNLALVQAFYERCTAAYGLDPEIFSLGRHQRLRDPTYRFCGGCQHPARHHRVPVVRGAVAG